MSFPIFKDFDKSAADMFGEDFDTKYSLKVKSAGPYNTTVTTNLTLNTKDYKIAPKIATKYVHASGFTLDKLEFSPDCKMVVETSLVGLAPGLKLEFKGSDSDKGDLSVQYALPKATITGDVDLQNFSSAKASVSTGHGPFTGGASVDLKIAKSSIESSDVGVGLGYTIPKLLFVGVKASKNFSVFSSLATYVVDKTITVGTDIAYSKKDGPTAALGCAYTCVPGTTMKAKATSAGILSLSLKQAFEKKFTVTGSAVIPKSLKDFKFGINATLG